MHAGTLLLAVQIALDRIPIRGSRFWGWAADLRCVLTKVVAGAGLVATDQCGAPLANHLAVVQAAHVTGAFWGVVLGLLVAALPGSRRAAH